MSNLNKLNREKELSLSPFASKNLILRDVFEGTLVIGLILRSLWGLYYIHETLWFYLVAL